jgi:ribonuclease HI
VYTRYSLLKWFMNSKSVQGRLLQWSALLSPWTMEVCKVERDEDGLAALVAAGITPRERLDQVAADLVPLKSMRVKAAMVSLEMLDAECSGYVLSFDGAAKLKAQAGSASFVMWKLPAWEPVHARSIYLDGGTVNEAEYNGLLSRLSFVAEWQLAEPVRKLVVVGDSCIVIQQCQGVIGRSQLHLTLLLNQFHALKSQFESVDLVHAKREFNGAADYLARLALRSGETKVIEDEKTFTQLS